MKTYLIPHRAWEDYKVYSYDAYLENFLIPVSCHSKVHKDVVQSLNMIEYLTAHAYFYYQFYDEATFKMAAIFEMAVRLRCEELDIPTQLGFGKTKTLDYCIKSLNDKGFDIKFIEVLQNSRFYRNMSMHPD